MTSRLPFRSRRRAAAGVGALLTTGLVAGGLVLGSPAGAAQVCLDPWKIFCWDDGRATPTTTTTTTRTTGPTTSTSSVTTTTAPVITTTTSPPVALPIPTPEPATLPGSTVIRFDRNRDGSVITVDRFVGPTDFVSEGIIRITGVNDWPAYCGGAVATQMASRQLERVGASSYRLGYLSSGQADDIGRCTTKPLEFFLREPARNIAVEFTGAAMPYTLTAYSSAGQPVATGQLTPASYQAPRSKIRVDSANADIQYFTFGAHTGTTEIRTVEITR